MGLGMAALMGFGALGIGISVDSVVQMIEFGITTQMLVRFSASACLMIGVLTFAFLGLRRVGVKLGGRGVSNEVQSKLELN